jgi:hypothetical protein
LAASSHSLANVNEACGTSFSAALGAGRENAM